MVAEWLGYVELDASSQHTAPAAGKVRGGLLLSFPLRRTHALQAQPWALPPLQRWPYPPSLTQWSRLRRPLLVPDFSFG